MSSLGLALGLSTIPIVAISLKKCVQVNFWEKGGLPGREGGGLPRRREIYLGEGGGSARRSNFFLIFELKDVV